MPGDVYCVIPTFKPDSTLLDLALGLSSQCPVLVVDDASPCTSDGVLRQVGALPGVDVVKHSTNAGIGRGLNDGLAVARGDLGARRGLRPKVGLRERRTKRRARAPGIGWVTSKNLGLSSCESSCVVRKKAGRGTERVVDKR